MNNAPHTSLEILAPAKINLTLNVTGRRDDGYHLLDSLVAFADIGDRVAIEPAASFGFAVKGPFARGFTAQERDSGPESGNLVVRAAWAMARQAKRGLQCKITLIKNLPLAAGLGGGSADAAAVIWGLMEAWGLKTETTLWLPALAAGLGADVPVCLACVPARMRGIGEQVERLLALPEIPVLLVNPGIACPTAEVFRRFTWPGSGAMTMPDVPLDLEALLSVIKDNRNDLCPAAVSVVPEIALVLEDIRAQQGCRLSRLSGSGATCFGLFNDQGSMMDAAERIVRGHPSWWVKTGTLNRPERY